MLRKPTNYWAVEKPVGRLGVRIMSAVKDTVSNRLRRTF